MKVLLVCFSGTGMTRYYASLIQEQLIARGCQCVCRELEELVDLPALWGQKPVALNYTLRAEQKRPLTKITAKYIPVSTALSAAEEVPELQYLQDQWGEFDLIGFGSPVYEFRPAPVMIRFMLDLPLFSAPPPAFSFATHDGVPGDFALFMEQLLTIKGFAYRGHLDQALINSSSLIIRRTYNRARVGRGLEHKSYQARLKISRFLDGLESISPKGTTNVHQTRRNCTAGAVALPWRLMFTWGMDLLLSTFFFGYGLDKRGCIRCHTCINQCPQGLLEIDSEGYPIRYHHCMYCLRCVNWCPTGVLFLSGFTRGKNRFPGPEALLEAAHEHHPERWVMKQ